MTYINYWLKEIVDNTPNDAELGSKIREISWKQDQQQEENKGKSGFTLFSRKK